MPTINWDNEAEVFAFVKEGLLRANEPKILSDMPFELSMQYLKWQERFLSNPFRYAKRAGRSFIQRTLRAAAIVLLVLSVSLGTLLAVNPEARAAVFNWFVERFSTHDAYYSTGEQAESSSAEWYPAYLPDGYIETSNTDLFGYVKITFNTTDDDTAEAITFIYQSMIDGSLASQDNERMEVQHTTIDGKSYNIYISLDSDKPNAVIWNDDITNTMFSIRSPLPCDTLLKIATKIEQKK